MSVTLDTNATVPSGASLSITVYEDIDSDGNADNSDTQSIDDGANSYSLSNLNGTTGNEFWIIVEYTPGSAATLTSAELSSDGTIAPGKTMRTSNGVLITDTGVIQTK